MAEITGTDRVTVAFAATVKEMGAVRVTPVIPAATKRPVRVRVPAAVHLLRVRRTRVARWHLATHARQAGAIHGRTTGTTATGIHITDRTGIDRQNHSREGVYGVTDLINGIVLTSFYH